MLLPLISRPSGSGRGIGQGLAIAFAEAGAATVVLAARSKDQLEETARAVEAAGAKSLTVVTDVSSHDSVAALFAAIDQQGFIPDVVCLNAGYCEAMAPLHESDPATWTNTWDVNVRLLRLERHW
jgi:NAD(P)-dependent dehydrogenase (short-subunit alcohol dehydrogenase family)